MQQTEQLPAGVLDSLSQFVVTSSVQAAADGATSGVARDHLEAWLRDVVLDNRHTAIPMSPRKALQYPPCYYAIQKVAGHLGLMSWSLKQRIGERRTREAIDHPAYRLLLEPNAIYPRSVFVETITGHAVFRGNGRAYIERDSFMRPTSMTILLPEWTETKLIDGEKWHITEILLDTETGERRKYRIRDRDVLHIMNFSHDGISGLDVYQLAKDSIALGLAAEHQQAKHFARNAMPGLLLNAPKDAFRKPEEAKTFLKDFRDLHEGIDNAGKTALITHGITATQLSHTGRDSQTVESRQHQREEVALWWALESMIGSDGQSYASEEQRQLAYLKGLPGKMRQRWEEESDRKLLTEREKQTRSHYHQMNPGSLLQADMQTTLETLSQGITSTIYSPNDAREILGLDAREGGDEYGNPNTSSPGSRNGSDTSALLARLETAYASRLQDLWSVEAKRIRDAIERGDVGKFATWVEKFYATADWPKTFGRVWQEFGGNADAGAEVMLRHSADLLKCLVVGDWKCNVEALLNEWNQEPSRLAAELARAEMGAEASDE